MIFSTTHQERKILLILAGLLLLGAIGLAVL
jgi:hypothetical protein